MSAPASLCEALCASQLQFPPIKFDSVAQMPGGREYRYASLSAVLNAVRPVLAANGVCLMQFVEQAGGIVTVTTLLWRGDERIEKSLSCPMQTMDFKGLGTATTYAARYHVTRMLAIAAEDDLDAAEDHHAQIMSSSHVQPPAAPTTAGAVGGGEERTFEAVLTKVATKTSANGRQRYGAMFDEIDLDGSCWVNTFDDALGRWLDERRGRRLRVTASKQGRFWNVVDAVEVTPGEQVVGIPF